MALSKYPLIIVLLTIIAIVTTGTANPVYTIGTIGPAVITSISPYGLNNPSITPSAIPKKDDGDDKSDGETDDDESFEQKRIDKDKKKMKRNDGDDDDDDDQPCGGEGNSCDLVQTNSTPSSTPTFSFVQDR